MAFTKRPVQKLVLVLQKNNIYETKTIFSRSLGRALIKNKKYILAATLSYEKKR